MGINKWVWIPLCFLMVFMIYSGYHYLNESETISNEEIQNTIEMSVIAEEYHGSTHVLGKWNWNEIPKEGLLGEDYIGVSVLDIESSQYLHGDDLTDTVLTLVYRNNVIFEAEGNSVENGIVFAFPNQIIDQGIFGNEGEVSLVLHIEEGSDHQISMSYLHTWTEHSGLDIEDARFQSPSFPGEDAEVPHWIIERIHVN